jgi:hypothetical protein
VIRVGEPPYLECSSKGFTPLSAFYARPSCLGGASIEDAYQADKRFSDGSTGHDWREVRRRRELGDLPVNQEDCTGLYSFLWNEYIRENPHLLHVIRYASGLSDVFGQPGRPCQAIELWRIRNS